MTGLDAVCAFRSSACSRCCRSASDGALYFTDPPYELLKQNDDPAKELKFNGVFRYAGGKLQVVVKDLTRPNGLAFSPDEKTFYVANSNEKHRVWMRYDVAADGTVSNGKVFADVTAEKEEGLPDGMKVDSQGKPPEIPANCGWAEDGKTLYITARTSVYRIKLAVAGEKPLYQ
jgi:gluconolactonase